MESDAVNAFLDHFIALADTGFGLIRGDVGFVLNCLIVISITLAGAQWALAQQAPTWPLFSKVLFIGLFAFLIDNWNMVATAIMRSGAMLGLKAGGDGMSVADLHNPGRIAEIGVELYGKTIELGDGLNLFTDFPTLMTILIAALAVMLGFFILALQVFVSLIAFKIGSLLVFVMLPWGVFKGTSFVAERPLGWVVGCAARLFALGLVASGAVTFVDTLPGTFTLEGGGVLIILLFGLTILALSWFVTSLAAEIGQGQPDLSGAHAIQTGLGAAAYATGAGVLATNGARALGGFVLKTARRINTARASAAAGAKAPAIDHAKFQPPARPRGRRDA